MITNYKPGNKKDLAKPITVSSTYDSAEGGVSVDFYYGPYGTPSNGFNYFTQLVGLTLNQYPTPVGTSGVPFNPDNLPENLEFVQIIDIETVTLPKNGTYYTYDSVNNRYNRINVNTATEINNYYMLVYKNKLDYEKQLAKAYLEIAGQMLPGKKVAFIDEFGKPIDHTVINMGDNNMDFINSEFVNIFTINFLYLGDLDGSTSTQPQVKHDGVSYTLPKCELIPPTYTLEGSMIPDDPAHPNVPMPQIFVGWTPDPLYNGETGHDELFRVNDLINLDNYYQIDNNEHEKFVNLYGVFMVPEKIDIDFQNGYYTTENNQLVFHSIDLDETEPDFNGFVKIPHVEPDNWNKEWRSYFFADESWNGNWMWVGEISWQQVLAVAAQKGVNTDTILDDYDEHIASDVTKGKYDFRNVMTALGLADDKKAFNYSGSDYWFFYIPASSSIENTPLSNIPEPTRSLIMHTRLTQRKWAVRVENVKRIMCYPNTSDVFDTTKQYYRQAVVDSVSNYINGQFYSTYYDTTCVSYAPSVSGATVQLTTNLYPDYRDRFEFDKWEVYAFDDNFANYTPTNNPYKTLNPNSTSGITGCHYVKDLNQNISCTVLDAKRSSQQGENADKYCDKYLMRAVYKEKNIFAYVNLSANNTPKLDGSGVYHMGWIDVYRPRRVDIEDAAENRRHVAMYGTNEVSGNFNAITLDTDNNDCVNVVTVNGTTYLKVNTAVTSSLVFKATAFNKDDEGHYVPSDAPEYVNFLKWKGEIISTNDTVTLPIEAGQFYELKAWFLRNDDANGYVVVNKGQSYTNIGGMSYKGSKVEIYNIAYSQTTINTTSGEIGHVSVNTCAGYRTYKDNLNENLPYSAQYMSSTPRTRQEAESVMTYAYLRHNANTTIGAVQLTRASQPVEGNRLKVDITNGTAYCYVVASVPINTVSGELIGLPFMGWNDAVETDANGNSLLDGKINGNYMEYERLVTVDVPGTFVYRANFNNAPSNQTDSCFMDGILNNDEYGETTTTANTTTGTVAKRNTGSYTYNVFDGDDAFNSASMNAPVLMVVETPKVNTTTGEIVTVLNASTGVMDVTMEQINHYTHNAAHVTNAIAQSTGATFSGNATETHVNESENTVSQTLTHFTLGGATIIQGMSNALIPQAPAGL